MSTRNGLILLVVLDVVFYLVLDAIFHNILSVFIACFLAALVGLVISLARKGHKA